MDCNTRLPFTQVPISTLFSGAYDVVSFRFPPTVDLVVMLSLLGLPMRPFGTFISLSASVNGNHPRGLKVRQRGVNTYAVELPLFRHSTIYLIQM